MTPLAWSVVALVSLPVLALAARRLGGWVADRLTDRND